MTAEPSPPGPPAMPVGARLAYRPETLAEFSFPSGAAWAQQRM